MRGPAELVDNLHPVQHIASPCQDARIACKGDRVAGHGRNHRNVRVRQRCRLRFGPGARRVDHHGVKALEFVRFQRASEQVPRFCRHPVQALRLAPTPVQGRQHRRIAFHGKDLGCFGKRKAECAGTGEQIHHTARGADGLFHRRKQGGLAFGRGLQEGPGRWGDQRLAKALDGHRAQRNHFAVPGQTRNVEGFRHTGQRHTHFGLERFAARDRNIGATQTVRDSQ